MYTCLHAAQVGIENLCHNISPIHQKRFPMSKLSFGKLLLVQSNITAAMGILPVKNAMCQKQYGA